MSSKKQRARELWNEYCGFIDLDLAAFMAIQEKLLMEQLQLLGRCELGRHLIGDRIPDSVEAFRQTVPLTSYGDYAPFLTEKQEHSLPGKVHVWATTSGRSGEYGRKWVPYTHDLFRRLGRYLLAAFIFGSTRQRGEFVFDEGNTLLVTSAPPPYMTGAVVTPAGLEHFPFKCLPPLEQAEKMDFAERMATGFRMGLSEGIDVLFGLGSVLVRVGEEFEQGTRKKDKRVLMQPRVLWRLVKGMLRSKLAGRPMLPKDIWPVKAVCAGGTDLDLFRDQIERYWGKPPVEAYASTEMGIAGLQTWGRGLTFLPDMGFWELIPHDEHLKSREDPDYQPRTVLLDEVEAGGIYELVLTNFHGGAMVRYRQGDLLEIVSLRDETVGIDIPQMAFHARGDDVIDLGGFTRMTERTIARALADTGLPVVEWTATKEVEEERPVLHLYLEMAGEGADGAEIGAAVHRALKDRDPEYVDWETIGGGKPPAVTLLAEDTFVRYAAEKQAAGMDLGRLKPLRMKPPPEVLADLLRLGRDAPG